MPARTVEDLPPTARNRWNFLLESMRSCSSSYTALNPSQKLHVVRGPPEDVLPLLWNQWGITHLAFEKDSNAYAKIRDERILRLAKERGVEVVAVHGRHLFDPEEVVKANKGKPTMTLHQWQSVRTRPSHTAPWRSRGDGVAALIAGDEQNGQAATALADTHPPAQPDRQACETRPERMEFQVGQSRHECASAGRKRYMLW